jgi:ketosteroid isomerase-like protein
MSEENVEIVVAYFQARDVRAAFEAISEDVTFTFHGEARRLSGAEELVGKATAVKWMVDWFSRFRDYQFEIEEALDWGDRVLVVTTHIAKGRTSGAPIREQTTQVMTVREGKIVRQDFFSSKADALKAAGLPE